MSLQGGPSQRQVRLLCRFLRTGNLIFSNGSIQKDRRLRQNADCKVEDSDAIRAYIQVSLREAHKLLGATPEPFVETWILFENMPHRRPKSWDKLEDPVCILRLNLYGHPLAGLLWKKYCQSISFSECFEKLASWECLYVHRLKKLFLSIYVDDFKMAGKANEVDKMWITLGSRLDLEPPVPVGGNVYLGCGQHEISPPKELIDKKREMFSSIFDKKSVLTHKTAEETEIQKILEIKFVPPKQVPSKKTRAYQYEMGGHAQQCVDRYLELAERSASSFKQVATPCIDDHQLSPEEMVTKDALSAVAAKIVLKVLYLARVGRMDLLWSVYVLAREVARWKAACDRLLHRLISYIEQSKHGCKILL